MQFSLIYSPKTLISCCLHDQYWSWRHSGGVSMVFNMYESVKRNNMPIGFEFSSNMHMYYAADIHTYSFSFTVTCVFLVWQTHFFFIILCQHF